MVFSIANRIKPLLDKLIDKTKTGFVPGGYIGESTHLVYDLLYYTEKDDIPGLSVIIDFEKACDLVSGKFIYKTLIYLGFPDNFIKWIKLFNTNTQAKCFTKGISFQIYTNRLRM